MNKTFANIQPLLLALLLCLASSAHSAPLAVGKISFARGSNAAQQAGSAPRILGNGAEIYQGDNIQTAERSFVIIEFVDGAKVTVRPNSNFSIDQYQAQANHPQATLSLHEGGVHTESGEIAKNSPDNFEIKTDSATIKGQQANYSVRVCHEDCLAEETALDKTISKAKPAASVVARIADIKGEVFVSNRNDGNNQQRRLSLGAPLYSEDYIRSGKDSYVLMVFKDGEKITLQAESEMAIADYHYQQANEKNHALYRLTTGGMRVLTGSIGKTNKEAFAIDTPVGTIGIRGTGFDLVCQGDCQTTQAVKQADIKNHPQNGLYSYVWQGQIIIVNDAGEFELAMPNSNYLPNRNSAAIDFTGLPELLKNNPFPRPDTDNANLQALFAAIKQRGVPPGVYVHVEKGHVQLKMQGKTLDLGKNETAYTNQQEVLRLEEQQEFQQEDPYLQPLDKNQAEKQVGIYSQLSDGDDITANANYQCVNE